MENSIHCTHNIRPRTGFSEVATMFAKMAIGVGPELYNWILYPRTAIPLVERPMNNHHHRHHSTGGFFYSQRKTNSLVLLQLFVLLLLLLRVVGFGQQRIRRLRVNPRRDETRRMMGRRREESKTGLRRVIHEEIHFSLVQRMPLLICEFF